MLKIRSRHLLAVAWTVALCSFGFGKKVSLKVNLGKGGRSGDFVPEQEAITLGEEVPATRFHGRIEGSGDDLAVFQTQRFSRGKDLFLHFPVPDGVYTVTLMFAETWSGAFTKGARVFDVYLGSKPNGILKVMPSFDMYASAGGAKPIRRIFRQIVSQGGITVVLRPIKQNPQIAGIVFEGHAYQPALIDDLPVEPADESSVPDLSIVSTVGPRVTADQSLIYDPNLDPKYRVPEGSTNFGDRKPTSSGIGGPQTAGLQTENLAQNSDSFGQQSTGFSSPAFGGGLQQANFVQRSSAEAHGGGFQSANVLSPSVGRASTQHMHLGRASVGSGTGTRSGYGGGFPPYSRPSIPSAFGRRRLLQYADFDGVGPGIVSNTFRHEAYSSRPGKFSMAGGSEPKVSSSRLDPARAVDNESPDYKQAPLPFIPRYSEDQERAAYAVPYDYRHSPSTSGSQARENPQETGPAGGSEPGLPTNDQMHSDEQAAPDLDGKSPSAAHSREDGFPRAHYSQGAPPPSPVHGSSRFDPSSSDFIPRQNDDRTSTSAEASAFPPGMESGYTSRVPPRDYQSASGSEIQEEGPKETNREDLDLTDAPESEVAPSRQYSSTGGRDQLRKYGASHPANLPSHAGPEMESHFGHHYPQAQLGASASAYRGDRGMQASTEHDGAPQIHNEETVDRGPGEAPGVYHPGSVLNGVCIHNTTHCSCGMSEPRDERECLYVLSENASNLYCQRGPCNAQFLCGCAERAPMLCAKKAARTILTQTPSESGAWLTDHSKVVKCERQMVDEEVQILEPVYIG